MCSFYRVQIYKIFPKDAQIFCFFVLILFTFPQIAETCRGGVFAFPHFAEVCRPAPCNPPPPSGGQGRGSRVLDCLSSSCYQRLPSTHVCNSAFETRFKSFPSFQLSFGYAVFRSAQAFLILLLALPIPTCCLVLKICYISIMSRIYKNRKDCLQ